MNKAALEHIIDKSRQKYSLWLKQINKDKHIKKAIKYAKTGRYGLSALLKKCHKKILRGLLFFKDPLHYIDQAKKKIIVTLQKCDLSMQKLMQLRSNPFHLLLNFFVITFLALSLLSNSKPFHMLFPALSFPIPPRDERRLITFYALSRRDGSLVAMQQYLLPSKSLDLRLRLLAALLAKPLRSKIKAGQNYTDLEVLPLLGNSIRRIWQPYAGHIIIDLSKDAIDYEMQLFHKVSGNTQRQGYYRDSFLEPSALAYFKQKKT